MNRQDFDNIARIGIIILLIAVPIFAETDWVILNNTFVKIIDERINFTSNIFTFNTPDALQFADNFESDYHGSRAEDMDIMVVSTEWNGIDGSIILELASTEGNEWQNSTYAYFNDSNATATKAARRFEEYTGNVSENDWVEWKFYNATGAGSAGCVMDIQGQTGNEIGIVAILGDKMYAYDNITPVEIADNTMNVWHTIRFTAGQPDKFNVSLDGVNIGQYTLYNGNRWDFAGAEYADTIAAYGISTLGGNADTCTMWIENVTNSWTPTRKITINVTSNVNDDRPLITLTADGTAQWKMPQPWDYVTDSSANIFIDENGYRYRGASSEAYKSEIVSITTEDTNKVLLLQPREYLFTPTNNYRYGFTAEEVSKIDTRLVDYDSNGEPANINTNAMLALAIAKIQELENRIRILEGK